MKRSRSVRELPFVRETDQFKRVAMSLPSRIWFLLPDGKYASQELTRSRIENPIFIKSDPGLEKGEFRFLTLNVSGAIGEEAALEVSGVELKWKFSEMESAPTYPPLDAQEGPVDDKLRGWRENLHLWIKVPNFLMPIHVGTTDKARDEDGHHSWVMLSMRLEGLSMPSERHHILGAVAVTRLGLAAGSDTEPLFWFKKMQRWPRGRSSSPLVFQERPLQAAIRLGKGPRFRLEAACEPILGLQPFDAIDVFEWDGRRKGAPTPLSSTWVSDRSDASHNAYRLEFSRSFYTGPSARLQTVEAGHRIRLVQATLPFDENRLTQRFLLTASADPAGFGERWDPARFWWNLLLFGGEPKGQERSMVFELEDTEPLEADGGDLTSVRFDLQPEPEARQLWSFSLVPHPLHWTRRKMRLRFPYLKDLSGESFSMGANVQCLVEDEQGTKLTAGNFRAGRTLFARLVIEPTSAEAAGMQRIRLGSLTASLSQELFDDPRDKNPAYMHLELQAPKEGLLGPAQIGRWRVRRFQIGGRKIKSDALQVAEENLLRIPVFAATPGGIDVPDRRNEMQAQREVLIIPLEMPKEKEPNDRDDSRNETTAPKLLKAEGARLWLKVAERWDESGAKAVEFHLTPRRILGNAEFKQEKVLYISWRPFLVALVRTNQLHTFKPESGSDDLAYWSTQGLFEGWQGRAAAEKAEIFFPPQAIGEAMEKNKRGEGEKDIDPGELVPFRLSPPSVLRVSLNDVKRSYAPMPWSLATLLDDLRANRLTGATVVSADIEILYGLGFHISPSHTGALRVGEVFARAGWPRRPLPDRERKDTTEPGGTVYDQYQIVAQDWLQELSAFQTRLAVYELFDEAQTDFLATGEPAGLKLFGKRGDASGLTAYLRGAADLRNPLHPDRNGLHGSFAWAFESENIFNALWKNDPNPATENFVEANEATLARLFFSALGGWGSQEARFDNGRTIIAAQVEMGRVSELRVERIGRVRVYWNKCKHVIVYRRSTLPTSQFEWQQDYHLGRPILRKAEEYIEFLEAVRRFPEKGFATGGGVLPAMLSACSCHERIYVDSRWGMDVNSSDGKPIGWKVPFRVADASDFYGPANVRLHFKADPRAEAGEVATRIENLEDVWFWTDVRPEYDSNTDAWPAIPDVDVSRHHETGAGEPPRNDEWGAPAVPPAAGDFTWRLAPLIREANLVSHLSPAGAGATAEPKQIGSFLRTITMTRGVLTENGPTPQPSAILRGHVENLLIKLEQVKEDAQALAKKGEKLNDAFINIFTNLGKTVDSASGLNLDSWIKNVTDQQLSQLKQQLESNIRWTLVRFKHRIEEESRSKFGIVAAEAKVNEWVKKIQNAQLTIDQVVTEIEGELKRNLKELPEGISYLVDVINKLATAFGENLRTQLANWQKLGAAEFDKLQSELAQAATWLTQIKGTGWWRGMDLAGIHADFENLLLAGLGAAARKASDWPQAQALAQAVAVAEGALKKLYDKLMPLADIPQISRQASDVLAKLRSAAGRPKEEIANQLKAAVNQLRQSVVASVDEQVEFVAGKLKALEMEMFATKPAELLSALKAKLDPTRISKFVEDLLADPNQIEEKLSKHVKDVRTAMHRAAHTLDRILPEPADAFFSKLDLKKPLPITLQRALGDVPRVAGLDFQKIAGEMSGELAAAERSLRGAIRSVAFVFPPPKDLANVRLDDLKVVMTKVDALVDQGRQIAKREVNDLKLKAASVVLPVKELTDRIQTEAEDLAKKGLQSVMNDFAGLKLEQLLGPLPALGESLARRLKDVVKIQHGFDQQTQSAFIDSMVDNLELGSDLSLFSFGPFECRLRAPRLFAHQRVSVGTDGNVHRQETGRISADWQMIFQGSPLVTFKESELVSENGSVHLNLNPKKLEMSSLLKAISDLCSTVQRDGSGFEAGILTDLPNSIMAFCRLHLELPPVGGGAFSITNLWLAGFFELEIAPKMFEIRCGLNIASREKPFSIIIFILGGCGWFDLKTRYRIPFSGTPELEISLDVGIGAAAGLAINLGFLEGSVLISLAVEFSARLLRGPEGNRNHFAFSIVLSFNGHVSILGIISVDLGIVLAVRYETGGGMVGEGRVRLRIKICWCFTLKVDKGFTYRFGKAGGGDRAFLEDRRQRVLERSYASWEANPVANFHDIHTAARAAQLCVC